MTIALAYIHLVRWASSRQYWPHGFSLTLFRFEPSLVMLDKSVVSAPARFSIVGAETNEKWFRFSALPS